MSEVESKIKAIYDRVDIASNGQRSTENWSNPSINLSAPAEMDYWQWIEEAEKDALDEFTIHNHKLTQQVAELKKALVEVSEKTIDLFSYTIDEENYYSGHIYDSLVNDEVGTIRSMVKAALKESE